MGFPENYVVLSKKNFFFWKIKGKKERSMSFFTRSRSKIMVKNICYNEIHQENNKKIKDFSSKISLDRISLCIQSNTKWTSLFCFRIFKCFACLIGNKLQKKIFFDFIFYSIWDICFNYVHTRLKSLVEYIFFWKPLFLI